MSVSWDTPGSPAAFGGQYVSFALRQHLSARHHLPPGLSYLVRAEELSEFHAAAHRHPGRVRGWLRVRRLRRARLKSGRARNVLYGYQGTWAR